MRKLLSILIITLTFSTLSSNAEAETNMLTVKVTFRERIALPPDAQLDVQLLDVSQAADQVRIASQRFAMTTVPTTVSLRYDERIVNEARRYAVVATIWSGDEQMFRTISENDAFGDAPVEITLAMVAEEGRSVPISRSISGIAWAVTEIEGIAWINDDPATLLIDKAGNFSAFGGCNRFRGELLPSDNGIAFPRSLPGTMMACPDETEAFERRFIDALVRSTDFVRYGAGLVMMDAAGDALLHFEERPE